MVTLKDLMIQNLKEVVVKFIQFDNDYSGEYTVRPKEYSYMGKDLEVGDLGMTPELGIVVVVAVNELESTSNATKRIIGKVNSNLLTKVIKGKW